jgi:Domain of unknown function (DUF5615)
MAALYANENFPLPVVEELRRIGHEVLTTHDAGQSGSAVSDEAVLEFAIKTGRAVLTMNRKHFISLHRRQSAHAGIVVCTVDRDFIGQAGRIHEQIVRQQCLDGQLIRINRPN